MTRAALALATLVTLLAGCGGGGEPAAQPSNGTDRAKLAEAVQCMRTHGFPDYPDPVEDHGIWVIPESANDMTPPPECLDLFRASKGRPPARALSAQEIAQRRQWAKCIREHGIPNLPDPDGEGNFQIPQELAPITAQPHWPEAREACRSLEWPNANFDK